MKKTISLLVSLKGTLLWIPIWLLFTGISWAEEQEIIAIHPVRPVIELRAFHAMDPETVQQGMLNAMNTKGASIDNVQRKFSESVSLLSWGGKPMKRKDFIAGSRVGFQVDSNGKIIALWNFRADLMPLP